MKLKLETIAPIHIGSGEIFTSYSDYIYEDGYVYYIDYDKLEDYIMNQKNIDDLMDDFVEIIKKQANSNKKEKYKLKNFFEEHGLDYKKYSYNKLHANEDIAEQINRSVSSGIRLYIPGSSIKGVIRTSFVYKHFCGEDVDLSKVLRNKNKPYIGQEVFGLYSKDIFKYLKVSDTTLLNANHVEVIRTHREHFRKKADIPINIEAIKAGTICELDIDLKFNEINILSDDILEKFYNNKALSNERVIFDTINAFTKVLLEREIYELSKINKERYQDIINQNTTLLNEVNQLLSSGAGAILRLGFGKTFYSNTVSMKFDEKKMKKIRKAVFSKKNKDMHEYKPFPITRTVYYKNSGEMGELGWVRIRKF